MQVCWKVDRVRVPAGHVIMDAVATTDKEAEATGEPLSRAKRSSPPRGAPGAASAGSTFRPFTPESLQRLRQRNEEQARAKELAKKQQEEEDAASGADGKHGGEAAKKDEEEPEPNAKFEAGKKLSSRLGTFPPSLYGKPIEDLDDFYDDKYVNCDTFYSTQSLILYTLSLRKSYAKF